MVVMNFRKCSIIVFVAVLFLVEVNGRMDGLIVNGKRAKIKKFPYVAYIAVICNDNMSTCGGTILNQDIIITASHCFDECPQEIKPTTGIVTGNEHIDSKFTTLAADVKKHENYMPDELSNDIALIRTAMRLKLSSLVKRVAILPGQYRESQQIGEISGWGIINEVTNEIPDYLSTIKQKVWSDHECKSVFKDAPHNTFCAGFTSNQQGYTSVGDSGSGLVVKNYILIGILSYKEPEISDSVAIYTNVANYYPWIKKNSAKLYCRRG